MSRWNRRSTAEEVSEGIDLHGKHAIVTGANTGIGLETARVLALRGCAVTMACRDLDRGEAARAGILSRDARRISSEQLDLMQLDLASLASVRSFAERFLQSNRPIHFLINNAGVMLPDRRTTADGFEAHFGINHLGHFLLTNLLLDRIRESAPSRVVNVASDAMHFAALDSGLQDLNWETRSFSGWRAYGNSKLMNLLFTRELTRRMEGAKVVSHALHPGVVKTELARDQPWYMHAVGLLMLPVAKNVERGSATTMYVATAPALAEQGGGYFSDCSPARTPKLAGDTATAERLWQRSAELVGL